MAVQVKFGQIVWAEIADANGIRKSRPAIVVTKNDRITPDRKSYPRFPPRRHLDDDNDDQQLLAGGEIGNLAPLVQWLSTRRGLGMR